MKGMVKVTGYKVGTKEIISETEWKDNLVMQGSYTGIGLILSTMANDLSHPLAISWVSIGTSTTAATIADTQLGAEVARGVVTTAQVSVAGGTLTLQSFIPDASLTNGTYWEVGSFTGGSASLNSGNIVNHAILYSSYVKGSGQDTTIQIIFTL